MSFSLQAQIDEVESELARRHEVYPRQIRNRRIRDGQADYQIARMEAVLKTLQWLQVNEKTIKQRLAQ